MFGDGCGEHGVVAGWAAVREWSSWARVWGVASDGIETIITKNPVEERKEEEEWEGNKDVARALKAVAEAEGRLGIDPQHAIRRGG